MERLERRVRVLRRYVEIADIDLRAVAEDHAVGIDEIDVLAALDAARNLRSLRSRDEVQVVFLLRALVKADRFSLIHREIRPLHDVVRLRARHVRDAAALRDLRPCRHDLVEHRRALCYGDSAEHPGRQRDADLQCQPFLPGDSFLPHVIPLLYRAHRLLRCALSFHETTCTSVRSANVVLHSYNKKPPPAGGYPRLPKGMALVSHYLTGAGSAPRCSSGSPGRAWTAPPA